MSWGDGEAGKRRKRKNHSPIPPSPHPRIGLFGGTFNPIHNGHLKMAEAARKEYKLEVVYFIPCGIPPHKSKKDLLPAIERLRLVKKAIKEKKYFKVLDIEIKSKRKSYTINTINKLKYNPQIPFPHSLFFLLGQDEFEKLHTWHKVNKLAKLVTFLVLPRQINNESSRDGINRVSTKQGNKKEKNISGLKFRFVHTKSINISSTQIRKNLRIK